MKSLVHFRAIEEYAVTKSSLLASTHYQSQGLRDFTHSLGLASPSEDYVGILEETGFELVSSSQRFEGWLSRASPLTWSSSLNHKDDGIFITCTLQSRNDSPPNFLSRTHEHRISPKRILLNQRLMVNDGGVLKYFT